MRIIVALVHILVRVLERQSLNTLDISDKIENKGLIIAPSRIHAHNKSIL